MQGREKTERLKESIGARVVGKEKQIEAVILALLAGGHVLLEDLPGVGKTLLAKTLAASLSCSHARIQFTPDTLPSDVTGASVFDASENAFKLIKGPVCSQIVLADELNRTSPKTQSALLEAMEERQVTIDGQTIPIPEPFMVIGTQNPLTMAGTYPLPEAQLDRFMMKLSLGSLTEEETVAMEKRFLQGTFESRTEPVLTAEEVVSMKRETEAVTVKEELLHYAARVVMAAGKAEEIVAPCSPRATLSLLRLSQARAYLSGRDFVIPEDILDAARLTLPHRIRLSAEAKMNRVNADRLLEKLLRSVEIPK